MRRRELADGFEEIRVALGFAQVATTASTGAVWDNAILLAGLRARVGIGRMGVGDSVVVTWMRSGGSARAGCGMAHRLADGHPSRDPASVTRSSAT